MTGVVVVPATLDGEMSGWSPVMGNDCFAAPRRNRSRTTSRSSECDEELTLVQMAIFIEKSEAAVEGANRKKKCSHEGVSEAKEEQLNQHRP